jgi:hypothetical protein
VVVFPEPLIPEKRITKGFDSEFFISCKKFGGLINRDSIDFFSSPARSRFFVGFPIKDSFRDCSIASTAS